MKGKFTIGLALVDAIPVLIFGGTVVIISTAIQSPVFLIGGLFSIFAGLGKVIWKIILAVKEKDSVFWRKQFKVTMPLGFLLMIVGIVIKKSVINWANLLNSLISFPAILFLILALCSMIAMITMAKKLDQNNAKHNWIEQGTNILMQVFVLLAVISIV